MSVIAKLHRPSLVVAMTRRYNSRPFPLLNDMLDVKYDEYSEARNVAKKASTDLAQQVGPGL